MALAKKCDRCGEYYDLNTKASIGNDILAGVEILSTTHRLRRYDLCDSCIEKMLTYRRIA